LKVDFWSELTKGKKMPIESLISTKVKISRLIKFRNYMNRLPYLRLRKSNLFKVQKLKLFNDLKRTLGIVVGTFFDRKI